jgi:hypothetical protein
MASFAGRWWYRTPHGEQGTEYPTRVARMVSKKGPALASASAGAPFLLAFRQTDPRHTRWAHSITFARKPSGQGSRQSSQRCVLAPSEEHIPGAQWITVPELLVPLPGAAASFFCYREGQLAGVGFGRRALIMFKKTQLNPMMRAKLAVARMNSKIITPRS